MNRKILLLVYLAVLTGITLLLGFTPLGYIKLGLISITIVHIPVLVGAALFGPLFGGFLGLVFGLTSLAQAPIDPIFSLILAESPLLLVTCCIVPRILMGLIAGFIPRFFSKAKKKDISFFVTGTVGSVLNTVLFIGSLLLLLSSQLSTHLSSVLLDQGKSLFAFWLGIGVANGIPEAIALGLVVGAICRALSHSANSLQINKPTKN